MGFSKKQHLQTNIDALKIAFKLEKENRQATVGEKTANDAIQRIWRS